MTLAKILQNQFRGDIRFRGAAYIKAERVSVTRVTSESLFALVRDGVEYQTQITRDEGSVKMFCNCSNGSQTSITCKHLWATILAADEGQYISGTLKPGYVPPFVSEEEPFSLMTDDWEEDLSSDVFQQFAPSTPLRPESLKVQPRLEPWEIRLKELRQNIEVNEPVEQKAGQEREIFYEIDCEQSQEFAQLVIQTSQRQRRANGQWGKLKPLKLKSGKLDEIEHEDDRKILAYLAGSTPERSNWHSQQTEIQSATFRYRVPYELCGLILPLMCKTGHLQFLNNENKSKELTWDEGPAWQLTAHLDLNEEEGIWTLKGELRRPDEVKQIDSPKLILPGGLVFTDEKISQLEDFGAFEWVNLFQAPEPVEISQENEQDLIDQLFDIPSLPRLDLPDQLRLEEIECEPVPRLTIRAPQRTKWKQDRLKGEVHFEYMGTMVPGSSSQWAIVRRSERQCLIRNRDLENKAWSTLQVNGFRRLLDKKRDKSDVEIAARDLGTAVRSLIDQGWIVEADGKQVKQSAEIQFRIQSGIDWFELHADIDFNGARIALPELLAALSRGDNTVRLDDGSLGILPEEWANQFDLLSGLGVTSEDHLRFSHNQVALLDALISSQEDVETDSKFEELKEKFEDFSGIREKSEPVSFKGELRPYQREGLGWLDFLQEFNFGGCLADDMGLGKTVQLLANMEIRYQENKNLPPTLIVVPKSLIFNWKQEANKFTPNLKVMEYTGLDRAPLREEFKNNNLVLTTYGTLRRDIMELKDIEFDYIVLDEAQTIKNSASQIAKASRLLKSTHRVALSGTPIENHLGDLWSIFEFLNPGMLGRSSVFKNYAGNIEDQAARKMLSQGLRPFILRRTKEQVASELPEKFEQSIYCDMGEKQQKLYDELKDHYRQSLLGMVEEQGLAKSKMHVL